MSPWWIGAAIGASIGLLRVIRRPAPAEGLETADPADWQRALGDSLVSLRWWLVIGPLCFGAVYLLLKTVGPASVEMRHLIQAIGFAPVVGVIGTTSLAMCRVGDARRRVDDTLGQLIGWSLIVAGGTVAGTLASVVVRILDPLV